MYFPSCTFLDSGAQERGWGGSACVFLDSGMQERGLGGLATSWGMIHKCGWLMNVGAGVDEHECGFLNRLIDHP